MIDPQAISGMALLLVNLTLLWSAGTRAVSPVIAGGPERTLATMAVVASVAVISALTLGVFGLGSHPLALTAYSGVVAGGAWLVLPRPPLMPGAELAGWWSRLGLWSKLGIGLIAGIGSAWAGWVLAEPGLDIDTTLYHLPEIAIWIAQGKPGAVVETNVTFPVGAYPITHEVLLAWAGGISRNVGVLLVAGPATMGLLVAALATILRAMAVRAGVAALALAVIITLPFVFDASVRISTDLAAVAWLAVAVAVGLRGIAPEGSPGAIVFAIIAFGLAIGTKTTIGLVGAVLVGAILWRAHQSQRCLDPRAALAGAAVAVGAGGVWYVRNLVLHGSPLWPFVSLPWGDPRPDSLAFAEESFLANPLTTLEGRTDLYLELLGPTPLLLVAAFLLALVARERITYLLAATVGLGAITWMASPFTGVGEDGSGAIFAFSSIRYLMAVTVVGVVTLAILAGGRSPALARTALGTLIAGALWGAIELYPGRDAVPELEALALGALVGMLVASGLVGVERRFPGGPVGAAAGAAALAVAALGLAAYPDRFFARYAEAEPISSAAQDSRRLFAGVSGWLAARETFADGEDPVYFYPATIGPLAGGGFEHELILVEPGPACAEVSSQLRRRWTVVFVPTDPARDPDAACYEELPPLARFAVTGAGFDGEIRVVGAPPGAAAPASR